jgi:F-type H+/Na+-transporting ATPase subunit alpha
MSVEKQIAIIYCGTKGLLKKVPIRKVHDFELAFLHSLEINHPQVLENLRKGLINDEITSVLDEVAGKLAITFEV